jgi:hypothetical protein
MGRLRRGRSASDRRASIRPFSLGAAWRRLLRSALSNPPLAARPVANRRPGPRVGVVDARDFSDWFFCEVEGPGDRLRPEQERKFAALVTVIGKPARSCISDGHRFRAAPRLGGQCPLIELQPPSRLLTRLLSLSSSLGLGGDVRPDR